MPIKKTNAVVEGPMGLKMPESIARIIEETSKTLPPDFTFRRYATAGKVEGVDGNKRTDTSVITTDDVDRDGEVVLPSGGDWSQYDKSVFFAHKYDQPSVGSCWWMKPTDDGRGLKAKTHYPEKPADFGGGAWMPSVILHMMSQSVPSMTGKSIGFIPMDIRPATAQEKAMRPEWKDSPIISRWKGLEYSVAPIPCNPSAHAFAVAKCKAAGLVDEKLAEMFLDAAGLKDMDEDTLSMPDCPKCMSADKVSKKEDGGDGEYTCAMCGEDFSTKKSVEVPAPEPIIPHINAETIQRAMHREAEGLREWAASHAKQTIEDAWARVTGRV